MLSKINICQIIKGHLKTLRYDSKTYRPNWSEIGYFIFLPILFAIIAIYKDVKLDDNTLTIIATVAVTFMALMFSVLIMVLDRYKRAEKDLEDINLKVSDCESEENFKCYECTALIVLRELYYNISYSIVIALFLSFTSVVTAIFNENNLLAIILSSIVIALGLNIILTILMIIKRIYIIFNPSS